jgi:hypothetical protein
MMRSATTIAVHEKRNCAMFNLRFENKLEGLTTSADTTTPAKNTEATSIDIICPSVSAV